MRISGTVVLDLRPVDPDDWHDRRAVRAVSGLCVAPQGADVVLVVARGQFVDPQVAETIRSDAGHVGSVTVQSEDPETIARWVALLRGADLAVAV